MVEEYFTTAAWVSQGALECTMSLQGARECHIGSGFQHSILKTNQDNAFAYLEC